MQQTEKYQLNLIETSDVFSPEALNENAQKLEAALSAEAQARQTAVSAEAQARAAETAARQAADAAEAQARTQADTAEAQARTQADAAEAQARAALDQRVTILEGLKVYVGYYTGNGAGSQHVSLGFTPSAVLIMDRDGSYHLRLVPMGSYLSGTYGNYFWIEEGGLCASSSRSASMNVSGEKYWFVAIP